MNKQNKGDAFERYENLPDSYHNDPRWQEVKNLRATGNPEDNLKANGLVLQIRHDYGFE